MISEGGAHEIRRLAPDGPWAAIVPARTAFAARVADEGGYSLVNCCVAPGFEFDDFTILDDATLIDAFPHHAATIRRYARNPSPR